MPLHRRRFGSTTGVRISSDALDLSYIHAHDGKAYEHDFSGTDVEIYGCEDGSIRLCHPTERLWNLFELEDDDS